SARTLSDFRTVGNQAFAGDREGLVADGAEVGERACRALGHRDVVEAFLEGLEVGVGRRQPPVLVDRGAGAADVLRCAALCVSEQLQLQSLEVTSELTDRG